MCGIAGLAVIREGERLPEDAADLVEGMCTAMRHRGPDDYGQHVEGACALGMRRLSIVDIAGGHQPMRSADGRITLVYNGEIYNAPALRRELAAQGATFRTHSDTEVILRLLERNPDDVERHLAGMWAFAAYDAHRGRLVLSRDRFGIKPLFVVQAGAMLAFASELNCFRTIRALPGFEARFETDPSAAHAMLSWGYVPSNQTIYRGVTRLGPATRLEVDLRTGETTHRRYYDPTPSDDAARVQSLDEACELTEATLARSVKEHLESDVPLSAFVSGGVDSSLVAALAAEAGARDIKAFSIGFDEARFDESPYATRVVQQLGLSHHVERFDEALVRASLVDALLAYDEPFGDSSSLATYVLSKTVARSHKVALAGDGGDEAFAGYKKYRILPLRAALGRAPRAREAAALALGAIPLRIDRTRRVGEWLRTARRLATGLAGDDAHSYAALTRVAALDVTAPLVAGPSDAAHFLEAIAECHARAHGSLLQRTLAADLGNSLPNDMLTKVDRASMACSLEVRVPFLDHRVVEVGLGLPQKFTLGGGGKMVLKELFARRFGRALAKRPKMGFGVPVEAWMRGSLSGACEELFHERRLERFGVLSAAAFGRGGYRTWLERVPQVVWHAFALAVWCEAQLGDGPEAVRDLLTRAQGPQHRGRVAPASGRV